MMHTELLLVGVKSRKVRGYVKAVIKLRQARQALERMTVQEQTRRAALTGSQFTEATRILDGGIAP